MTSTNVSPRERSAYWDNVKFLLISLVVLGHCLWAFRSRPGVSLIVGSIYLFHMPAFVFVSGFFSKSDNSRSAKSLLRLWFAFFLLTAVYWLLAFKRGTPPKLTVPYYSAWYLLALIVWRFVTPWVTKIKYSILYFSALAILAGFWIKITNEFALSRIICFYPFFLAGYYLSFEKAAKLTSAPVVLKIVCGGAALAVAAALAYWTQSVFKVSSGDLLCRHYAPNGLSGPAIRILIFTVASFCIIGVLALTCKTRLPLITTIGKNSLAVYLIHRPIVSFLNRYFDSTPTLRLIAASVIVTVILLIVLGSNPVSNILNRTLDWLVEPFVAKEDDRRSGVVWTRRLVYFCAIALFALPAVRPIAERVQSTSKRAAVERKFPIYRVAAPEQALANENAFKLLFCGDLLLLEDPVKLGNYGETYDYSEVFEHVKEYLTDADYSIGVFEGPCAGKRENGYSTSNYGDGKALCVNFPDEFAYAVKNAGFDLVTTANNHFLDCGEDGAKRTLEVLDSAELDHLGTYSSPEDKQVNRVKIIEKDGLKFAVLAYTYDQKKYRKAGISAGGDKSYFTSLIVDEKSEDYPAVLEEIKKDFELARSYKPDFIVALPHWGTQFADYPNGMQLHWEKVFKELGADIVLGDHTHSVQPVKVSQFEGRTTFTAYCPGNFTNIYREHNGDLAALVEVNIDKKEKRILGGAIVPMWITAQRTGNYRPIPIYSILTDPEVGKLITVDDMKRVDEAMRHITGIMLGETVDLNLRQKRYSFDENGFYRDKTPAIEIRDQWKTGVFYRTLADAENVCFIGDSVEEGWRNGGVPWSEPLEALVKGNVAHCGYGSATVRSLISEHMPELIANDADLFVVAIGTNDVRYRDPKRCAMTPEDYAARIGELKSKIQNARPNAKFVFIAPWYATDGDLATPLSYPDKLAMYEEYSNALRGFCEEQGDLFIDPNPYIKSILDVYPHSRYMLDYVHPNATDGVNLYSEAVLSY